jgi:thymidylate synthase (FAD)
MKVELVDWMGTDLTVVNAARVSYAKTKTEFSPQDEKLIKYLADHEHWSPFGHASLQFRIKAPVFVARQLVKHQVGLIWNEVSRRYVDYEPEFYHPETWRGKPKDSKQGSEGEVEVDQGYYERLMNSMRVYYDLLLNSGVAPEMARMVLPQSMMTEWYWSGSLYAFARVCNLRCAKDTQLETQNIANQIDEITKQKFPISWRYLRK